MEIYGDIFFLINFCMDLLIFWATGKLMRRQISVKKIIAGALILTISYCVSVFMSFYNIWYMLIMLGVTNAIIFMPKNLVELLKVTLLVHIVAFSLGGMTMGLNYYIDFSGIIDSVLTYEAENFSLRGLMISGGIFFTIIKIFSRWAKKRSISKQIFYKVRVSLRGQYSEFEGLVDTGNSLYDATSGLPIIIVEFSKIKSLFNEEMQESIAKNDLEKLVLGEVNFRFVPFKSIGSENGLITCFKPDYVEIISEKKFSVKDVLVGICLFDISNNYSALINPDILANLSEQ